LDRRTNRPNGSGGASPTVVTDRQDDDLTADTDEPTQILGSSPVRTATRPAKPAPATKEAAVNGAPATEALTNGLSATDGTEDDVPALPADTIGSARDPFAFSRPVSSPVSPSVDGDWTPAENGASPSAAEPVLGDPVSAAAEPTEPLVAETGTGWPIDTSMFETGSAAGDPSPPQPADTEPSVSAAAFVWNAPEPAPTSPSSPARNFLRSNANAKNSTKPRTPTVSVGPGQAQAGPGPAARARPGPSARPKPSSKRSARQAHLTIARVEPWSVMKFSFVVSLVAFVILFVAVSVIYGTLSALGVFTSLQHVVQSVTSSQDSSGVNAAKWFTASRILSYTALLGALNIVLITAMSTIGAVVYNLTSRLIGGVEVTLRETE
jgi:Transmembrane domain of unknown function (DUF3566)